MIIQIFKHTHIQRVKKWNSLYNTNSHTHTDPPRHLCIDTGIVQTQTESTFQTKTMEEILNNQAIPAVKRTSSTGRRRRKRGRRSRRNGGKKTCWKSKTTNHVSG